MKIHQSPYSSNSRKVLMTAYLLGLRPELIHVDLAKGEQRAADFVAINPNGKVPVMVDEDFVLFESHAIMAYLCDKTPGQTLYPRELRARADVNKWMFWSANHFGPAISMINWERSVKKVLGLGEPDRAQVERGEALFHTFAKVLEAHLERRDWLSGKTLTLADLAVGCPLMVAVPAGLPLEPYPRLWAWFERLQALDEWKRVAQ